MRRKHIAGRYRDPIRDEAGVVAIIVALSISTFLLGFAALAVDMGTAYVRKAELQSVADKLAIAGADGLPTITSALTAVMTTLGRAPGTDSATDPGAGLCADADLPTVCGAPGWEYDGKTDNGEITFYSDEGQTGELADRNGDGVLDTADKLVRGASQAVGIDVMLPPSRVDFGFAGALGFDGANIQEHATARIGTPLGSGILPFALTPSDVTLGQFCVTDPTAVGTPVTVPAPRGLVFLTILNPSVQAGDPLSFFLAGNAFRGGSLRVHFENDTSNTGVRPTQVPGGYTVPVPAGTPGSVVRVWVTGRLVFGGGFTSTTGTIQYRGNPTTSNLCSLPQSARGYVQLARSTAGDPLAANIRSGPQAKLYPSDGVLGAIGSTLGCLSTTLGPPPSTSCLVTASDPFSQRMTDGFFNSAGGKKGRLVGSCTGDTPDSPHGFGGVDGSQLLDTASPLVDFSFGNLDDLEAAIGGAAPVDKEGWVRSRALQCPRLAVMPIVSPVSSVAGTQDISGFTYVWIDDDGGPSGNRGFTWTGNRLRSFQGFVISPKLLPELVSGSPLVGPYLGPDMPVEAMLLPEVAIL